MLNLYECLSRGIFLLLVILSISIKWVKKHIWAKNTDYHQTLYTSGRRNSRLRKLTKRRLSNNFERTTRLFKAVRGSNKKSINCVQTWILQINQSPFAL